MKYINFGLAWKFHPISRNFAGGGTGVQYAHSRDLRKRL